MAVEKLACPACGASVKRETNQCDYCTSTIVFKQETNSLGTVSGGNCPACGKEICQGIAACTHCGTILHDSPKLERSIKKVMVSQKMFRERIPFRLEPKIPRDEFLIDSIYGVSSWFLLTSKKLYQYGYNFAKRRRPSGSDLLSETDLNDIVDIHDIKSRSYDGEAGYVLYNSFRISTLDMDVYEISAAPNESHGDTLGIPPGDIAAFASNLRSAFHKREDGERLFDEILYSIGCAKEPVAEPDYDWNEKILVQCPKCDVKFRGKGKCTIEKVTCPNCKKSVCMLARERIPLVSETRENRENEQRPEPKEPIRQKSKGVFLVLALLLGGVGVHRFYLGSWIWGLLYFAFCWTYIPLYVAIIEFIVYLCIPGSLFDERYNRNEVEPWTI